MSDVLKQAMLTLYRDSPEILYCLQQLDFTQLNTTFQKEIDARIDRKTYDEVEKFLASEDYLRYVEAVNSASMSMTRPISELLEFVLTKNEGEIN